ncbi:heavy metal translocating P-type ATPase [Labrys monachus]|uniref:heavy metal translocating P-type ATPase n=1 Tax=Labrys monachus TaxID=217067 RepID=UPI0027D8EC35|nr:heavy metal translocating P-type ATPase [Labrys monachus]
MLAGAVALYAGQAGLAASIWVAGTAVVLAILVVDIVVSLRRGEFGLDLIAALAMAGALLFGEHLAGIIVALMFTGGEALEGFAQRRARREMTALLSRMPRTAARYAQGGLQEVALAELVPGDRVLVRRGEVVPVDGTVGAGVAVLDESALTGEALPVRRRVGEPVMSGVTNAGDAFDLRAESAAADSTYAGIIRLVEAAQEAKAPMARLADRFALLFLALTLAIAGGAWAWSGEAVRALAVIVVATPCPLILAVPVAIISGISRCAKRGVIVKGGGALERLAGVRTVLLDKTGTVTDGRARLIDMRVRDDLDPTEFLRLAASLDQGSPHVVARALVAAARERGLALDTPTDVREVAGSGVAGRVGEREVLVGGWDFVSAQAASSPFSREIGAWIRREGTVAVVVAVDGTIAGALLLADQVRPEAGTVLRHLRDAGVRRIVLVTGDRADLAAGVAAFLGVDDVRSEMKPQDKTMAVEAERANGPVLMVGDGVNDAPALAAADIGVAMGARGAAASSEAADVVILVDRLDRLVSAMRIARRSRAIALQSVYAGMGLSLLGMVAAAFGYLTPVEGALLQEAIDVAVILNALRALAGPIRILRRREAGEEDVPALEAEHRTLGDVIDDIRATAARLPHLPGPDVRQELARLDGVLHERLLPHEERDERVYAGLRRRSGARDALAGMSRTHMEIQRQVHNLASLREALPDDGPGEEQRYEIERLLHGLEAITRLHFAQEDEIYRSLDADGE